MSKQQLLRQFEGITVFPVFVFFRAEILSQVKFSDFICRHLGERDGNILEAETGKYLGNHKGFWFYTIGQRQGLRLSDGPW